MTDTFEALSGSNSGTKLVTNYNNARNTLISSHSATARPNYATAGTIWYDITNSVFKLYDGTSDLVLWGLDLSNHLIQMVLGGGVTSIASASTVNIGSSKSAVISITGTTTIASLGTSVAIGQFKILLFNDTITLTHSANLYCPNTTDLTAAANDMVIAVCTALGTFKILSFGAITSAALDKLFGTTQGAIIYRNATVWTVLAPGSSGQVLTCQGVSANPHWDNASTSHGKQLFNSSGTFTVPSGVTTVYISGSGGGGGGGSTSHYGSSGGATSFGVLVSLLGGAGGGPHTGDIDSRGYGIGGGLPGRRYNTTYTYGGPGTANTGSGGGGGYFATSSSIYSGLGGLAGTNQHSTAYTVTSGASYTVTIGAGGAGGISTLSDNTGAGGAGGSGWLLVEW